MRGLAFVESLNTLKILYAVIGSHLSTNVAFQTFKSSNNETYLMISPNKKRQKSTARIDRNTLYLTNEFSSESSIKR